MGLRFIEGHEAGSAQGCVVMFDSVTGVAFGRKMGTLNEAEAFVRWSSCCKKSGGERIDLATMPTWTK